MSGAGTSEPWPRDRIEPRGLAAMASRNTPALTLGSALPVGGRPTPTLFPEEFFPLKLSLVQDSLERYIRQEGRT